MLPTTATAVKSAVNVNFLSADDSSFYFFTPLLFPLYDLFYKFSKMPGACLNILAGKNAADNCDTRDASAF